MRKSIFCLLAVLLFSTNAFAGLCENAVRNAQKKAQTLQNRCNDSSAVDRQKKRLLTAKTDRTKASIQKLIDKAVAKQQSYCTQGTTQQALVQKLNSFCSIASSASTSYCRFGYSLRIKGNDASSRCKRGRMWFPGTGDVGKCYYEEEYYYTSATDFGNGKATGSGEILWSGNPPGTNFYQINTGFLVGGITNSDDCAGK